MHEEFEKLLKLIQHAGDQAKPNVNELVLKTLEFFQAMKREFLEASPAERKELIGIIKTMHEKLTEELTKVLKKVGMTEDQLPSVLEDPKMFSPQQQEMLRKAKGEIEDTKRSVTRKEKEKGVNPKEKGHTSRKDKWMKS